MNIHSRLVALAAAFLCAAAPIAAGATGTPITSVPFSISTAGRYYLANDLTLPAGYSTAITINADSVTLDLNDCRLSASPANGLNTAGIGATNHKNITIENGAITGFTDGVSIGSTSPSTHPNRNIVIRDLTIDGADQTYAWVPAPTGIYVNGGSNVLVKNVGIGNMVNHINNSYGGGAYGVMLMSSDYVRVLNVDIGQMQGTAVSGIYLSGSNNFIVRDCVIDYAGGGPGFYSPGNGIYIDASCMSGHVTENRIVVGNLTINSLYTKYGNNMVETLGGGYYTQGINAGNNQ